MADPKGSSLSAQVVLLPASGKLPRDEEITAANIKKLAVGADAADVLSTFRQAGFEVGNVVGISFSITGTPKLFEKFFGVKKHSGDLPVPAKLKKQVHAVTFPDPPDFGPGNFS